MSGRRVNLQDLTRLLTQGRRSQDQSQDPSSRAEASEVGGPGNQDATTRPPEAVISPSGENIATLMSHTEDTQDGASSTGDSSGEFSQPKQLVEDTKGFPEGDPTNGNLTEFVHEVEFQHNTLLGKMQLLREALAQQLASTDEREDVQKKTFAKWINSQLVKGQHPPVTDLFYDLRDGTRLLALLEVLTNKSYKREKGRMRVHHLNNVSRALNILEEHSVKLVNISNEHIVDGSAKLTLGLVWAIILHWQVQGVLKDVMSDLQQTNLEKTLLAWCRQTTKGYHGVDVRNFTTSWTDGLAFNALIHSHRPQLFDWTVMARKHPYARLENAFRLANEHLNIERLLDPEDVNSQVPDKKSIMMYVMCLFQALPHGSFTMDSLDVSLQSDSSFSIEGSVEDTSCISAKARPLSTASIGLSEYQRTLEEVLTWLLGAEDRLAAMPPIAETTEAVKEQFHDLEELMLELTSKQGGIGDVLGEGSRLMREGVMEEEEEEEVRVQMKLLNTRWEELRVKAMDRQSSLHEKLMSLQQKQLESLKKWLTDTEDRIANMSQVGPTAEALREQILAHQNLQQDLENEQSNINSLSNMVVVVDETSSESAYSTLEDELNALGERWAHICRWSESRWTTLQTLSVHWEHFEREVEKISQWLDDKETTLRQVESNPSTEQEHCLRHASMLQVLQAEMEVQHRCIAHLQEESSKIFAYIPEESPAYENISANIESIQDRMDCLVSMIEAQTQRMAASGIDITKVMVPVDGSNDVVSSSTTTISHEGATVITKIITTKVTEMVKGNVVKRQKLEGSSQEDFSMALHQLGGWMDSVEAQIKPKAIEELTLEQLSQVCQQVESEMESQKEEYYKVVSLGESAISETSTIGESVKESEQQMANVSNRWEALTEMLVEIRTRITFLTQKKKITTELSDLEVHYQGFLRWFENVRTVSENEPNSVTLQAEQCKSKITAMENLNKDIAALKLSTEVLNSKWAQEIQTLAQQIETFHSKWEILMQRFLEWNETLKHKVAEAATTSAMSPPPPPESLLKAMAASRKWLESLEAALASEYSVTTLPQMQDYLTQFKDLSEKVELEKGNMAHINETCHRLSRDGHVSIMEDITKLNKQWETTTEALQFRIKNIERVIEKQKQYNDEVSGLKSWLAEVDIFLQAEEAALGDIETLEAQLEQSNALQDDVATLQTNVDNITAAGKQLTEEGDAELKNIVENQLEELTKRWDLVTELARAQNKSLKEALARSQKVHEGIDKLNVWLDELEPKIPCSVPTNTPEELINAVELFTQLREDISIHSDDLRAINNIGDEMLQLDSSATHEELARRFTQLNGRWTDVVTQVDSKYKVFITAAQQYEDFKKVCSEESDWLDQLQAKLERSSKDAADAEEISEALDELEIFLHSHDESRLERIRSLAESLVQEGCVVETVQETTRSLTSRFDTLNAQASEQQSGLEGCVQEAQAWEREYVSVLDYLAQSDLILTQAITNQIQVDQVQVQEELLTQQVVLKKMQTQVEVYHSQGKTEAALRLEDQIAHLQKKYEEIEMKLQICQKPSDFDTRLTEVNQQLQEIGQRVHLVNMDSGDPEGIQEQLNQCLDLYQTLSEVKSEVESVIATGRKIVKEGQSSDPDGLTLQLDQLKALYNKLGGTVTEHRGILEKALRHSRKIHKDCNHLEEWLSTTECELDQREATVPATNVQGEVHFAQHAIDDLGRKKPLLTGLHESYTALTSLSDDSALLQPIKEQVDDIALTWERVSIRLANRLKNMQDEQAAKEAEMERFIIGLGEIKGWLESTEHHLLALKKLEPSEQDKIIKSVSSEIQNYKGQIENIRDTAVDLINHGVLFQARIQPELVLINQRWENIYRTVQVTSACEIDSSSIDSVTRSSTTGLTSVFPTISPITSDHVQTCPYHVESSKSLQGIESPGSVTDSGATVTHIASGMSSSMLDFLSRHNVVIVDPDAKLNETLDQQAIGSLGVHTLEVNINEGINSLGISTCEEPIQSLLPIAYLGSEIKQERSAILQPVEDLSVPSSSSVSFIKMSDIASCPSSSDKQHNLLESIQLKNYKEAESQISIEDKNPKLESNILEASVVPSEMTMEMVNKKLPLGFEHKMKHSAELISGSSPEALMMLTQNMTVPKMETVEKPTGLPGHASDDSVVNACHMEVINAADIESGSVIEITYQVEDPEEKMDLPLLPEIRTKTQCSDGREKDNTHLTEELNASLSPAAHAFFKEGIATYTNRKVLSHKEDSLLTESQTTVVAPHKVIMDIERQIESSSYQTAQDVHSIIGENVLFDVEKVKSVCIEESALDFSNHSDDFKRKISTASVEIDISAEEVATSFDSLDLTAGSFAFERQAAVALEEYSTDNIVTVSHTVQLIDGHVCAEASFPSGNARNQVHKISIASLDIELVGDEIAGILEMSSFPTQSFADEKETYIATSPSFTDQVVASEIVSLTASGNKDIVTTERKASTVSEKYVISPQDAISAISAPLLQEEAFTFPEEMHVSLEENLETRIAVSDVVPIKDLDFSAEIVEKSLENSSPLAGTTTVTDKTERKLSTAIKDFEIMPQEITEDLGIQGVNVMSFAMKRSVSERAMEGLKEAILVSPETVLQGSPYRDENATVQGEQVYSNNLCDEINRKISTASVEMEFAPSEILLEEEQTLCIERFACAKEVLASGQESCSANVVLTTVKAVIAGTVTKESNSSEVSGETLDNMEVASEISEEGLPLGCEAALIDPSVISGYVINSQSGEGSDFGEISTGDIAFIQGIKSAIPTGYTFATNTVEDDCLSEALSYFDIETSVDVKDKYGVAVTVIGTRSDLNVSIEDTEEKQIPHEEGGLEELKMESSLDSLLNSSRYSSRGRSLDNLLMDIEYKETKEMKKDYGIPDDSVNRGTFLTEILSFTDKEYIEKALQKSNSCTYHTVSQKTVNGTLEKSEITRASYTANLPNSVCDKDKVISVSQSSKQDKDMVDLGGEETSELSLSLDKLQNIPQTISSVKDVKKAEIETKPEVDSNVSSLLSLIKYDIVKKDDSKEEPKPKFAKTVLNQDKITKVQYTPKSQVTRVEDKTWKLKSDIAVKLEEKHDEIVWSHCTMHEDELPIQQVSDLPEAAGIIQKEVDVNPEEYCAEQKSSSKLPVTAIHYVPYVPVDTEMIFQEKKSASQQSSDNSRLIPQETNIIKEETSTRVINETTEIVTTRQMETNVSTVQNKETKIHYVPHAPSDILRMIPEEKFPSPKEIVPRISNSKQEQPNIYSVPVNSEDRTVPEKYIKSCQVLGKVSAPLVTTAESTKPEEIKFTNKESCIKQEDLEGKKSKILYVPHVPVSPVTVTLSKEQMIKNLTNRESSLSCMKETDITSDEEEKITTFPVKEVEIQNKKAHDITLHYVPHVPVDQGIPEVIARSENMATDNSEQKTINIKEIVKSEKVQKSVEYVSQHQTSDKKTESNIEAQVHVPVSESKDINYGTKLPENQKKELYAIHYVPCVTADFKKTPSGPQPTEIHYVPHSPADLENFKSDKTNVKFPDIPSSIITSPSTSKFDAVVTSSSDISKNLKKQSTRGPASETVYASRSYIKESAREQINVTSSNVSTVLADIHGTGQSVQQHLGDDEVDAFLREVTAMADKISEIKTKLQMVPSYQEAKEKAEALEQEVALLEPDVATVISHGDTLTLTTHMVDVPRANTIRIAVNDLRTHWSALKSETENVKLESEQVAEEISTISEKADEIISWSNDVSKRLHLVNNDESQLEALENEMTNKKAELDKLNESGILLKKYKYNQIQPVLTLLNMRWTEISMKFRQYRKGSLEKKTIVSTTKVESQETEPIIVPDFVASVNRLREAISVISRQLNATKLLSNQYDNLKTQEDELKGIKHGLETLKPRVDNLETERNAIVKNVSPTESEQVRRVMDKLREEWAQVNRGYTDKHSRWLQCSETWRTLQKTIDDFSVWLNTIEEKVQCTSNQPLPEAKITQKELEKQVTLKHRPSQTLQSMCKEVTEGMSADDGKRLQENVDSLMKRWRALLLDLAARRERIAGEEGGKESANSEYEALITWVDQAQALMDAPVNVTDEASLSAHTTMVQNHLVEMMTKQNLLKKLKDMKPKSITSAQMTTLETNLNKVVKTLPDYKNMVDTKLGIIKTLVADVEHLYKWTEEMRVKVALRNLTEEEIKLSKMTLREKEALYENLDSTYWVLAQDAEGKGLTVAVPLKNRMNTIESRLKALQGQVSEAGAAAITPTLTSPTFQTPPPPYVAGSRQKVDQEMAVKSAKEGKLAASRTETSVHATGTTVTSSVTSVIQDVIKFEESVLSAEGGLRAPSPLVSPPRHAPDSSPVLILASLDKSILQIRDWLTLMEQMTRQQTVVVGDADDIRQLTEKQKSVLRELEGKKPQLDELVASADSLKDDASRTQLHQKASEGDAAVYRFPTHSRLFDHLRTCFKVSKLREHWDETNSVVLARKTQLDAMYTDTHKFDAKRAELESWLARMEARLERMAPVARTADVLDQQIREQKGFHAEIHQYKHQVELFNQMTQRLIAIYQHDDTRRLKKITETINLRYSSLNSSIIARGKELHSAMNSLHNFDKALDKFASWMSEAESNTDLVELEVDKLGPARRDPQARGPSMHLKVSVLPRT
ncbi:microtubule-actin cross-linking factor 1 isoform X2 [Cherax quadricarinatus]